MKKIFTILILFLILIPIGFSQPTGDLAIENPRIVGTNFYFDIYFKRTNNDPNWHNYNNLSNPAAFGGSSWVCNLNTTGNPLINPVISYTNPTYLTSGYSHSIAIDPPLGIVRITTTPTGAPADIPQDIWWHAFTVQLTIANSSVLSLVTWDALNTGLVGRGNLTNSLNESYFDSDCDIALNTKCWTGVTNTEWNNASNWSPNGVPGATDDIIYPNNPANEVGAYGMLSKYGIVNNLRVNHHAQLKVIANRGLTVSGNIILKGDTNIVLESTTNINPTIYSSALITNGSIDYNGYSVEDGHIEVHRTLYFEDFDAGFYLHQVAAPVQNVILDDWDMEHFHSYAYEWNTILQDWWNIYVPSRNTPSGYGFVLSLYNDSVTAYDTVQDVVFYDNLLETDLNYNFNGIEANEWAMIGNPYTAPIIWDDLSPQAGILNQVWVWDPATGTYDSYVEGTGGDSSARLIQPGQSFWIQATGSVSQFNIPRSARKQRIHPYLKETLPNLLHVYTEGGNMTSDKVYIRFKEDEGVTAAYDLNHDGEDWASMYEEFATEIYTVSSDGINLWH